jgi:hypothetical protein
MSGFAAAADENKPDHANDQDRIICKSGNPPVGSRLPGPRECHTKAQWDEMQRASREATQDTQKRMLQGPQPAGPGG